MERLTTKDYKNWIYGVGYQNKKDSKLRTQIEHKLGEFEDFMEANKFKNIQELQNAINGKFEVFFDEKHKIWIKTVGDFTKCKQENQALKDRWEKLVQYLQSEYDELAWVERTFNYPESDAERNAYKRVLDKMEELEEGEKNA